jgi:hypothetical protein
MISANNEICLSMKGGRETSTRSPTWRERTNVAFREEEKEEELEPRVVLIQEDGEGT